MFHDISFAFVTFVNAKYPYPQMMQYVLESHRLFSRIPLILYAHTIDPDFFPSYPGLYVVPIPEDHELPSIYYYKPYVICDAVEKGLQAGYYIEADDILTPDCDSVQEYLSRITTIPISPVHPDGCTPPVPADYRFALGATEATQPYCHGHILFRAACLPFLRNWFTACLQIRGLHWDESVLNCLYWKEGCRGHYLPIIDMDYNYFLLSDAERKQFDATVPYEGTMATPITVHGAKDLVIIQDILARLKSSSSSIEDGIPSCKS